MTTRRDVLHRLGLVSVAAAVGLAPREAHAQRPRTPTPTPRAGASLANLVPVNRTVKQNGATATTVTTAAIATTSGNLLVALVTCFGNHIGATPITDTAGNTWQTAIASVGTTKGWAALLYCPNCVGNAAHTFTFTASATDFLALAVWEIPNAHLSAPLSNTSSSTASTAAHTSGPITANALVPEILIGGLALSAVSEGAPLSVQPFWNSNAVVFQAGANAEGFSAAYRIVNPSTTDAFAVTTLTAANETILIAGFKAAAAASSGGEIAIPF